MTQVIYNTATSFTGFITDESNSLSWLFAVDTAGLEDQDLFLAGIGVVVEGSTTYEWVLREEELLANPHKWREFYGDRPTFVFTSRDLPTPDGADVRFVRGNVAAALPAILAAAGEKDVWVVGGGDLAGQFLDADALDTIILSVAPVALPGGAPLLPRRVESDRLELVSATAQGQFATLTYRLRR
ncbi:dihydrofolate reductase family protein [Cryobacterium sp. GrIS_2_6]|uniref:dihydrofolate reductase family protein n=1 Tax=Cryobacterium sp. GrIS_2_6 TaxID=3162785 RepID=UPI002E052DE8|nr:dihydrofolate reductase [Cryobacterium psychrotolerans]